MATKYGVFSETGVLGPGADYLKEDKKKVWQDAAAASEKAGFKSGQAPRTGKLNDATFSEFTSTNVCAPYEDSHRPKHGAKASTSKSHGKEEVKAETSTPFRPASPMKKPSAPQAGDNYGVLSKTAHAVAPQVIPAVHKKKGDIKAEPRGIYTTVPRSGGYGTNNFTLSETKKGSKGVAGEYEYMADPMRATQPHTKGEKAEQGKPFVPAHNANNEFAHIPYLENPPADENSNPKSPKKDAKKDQGPAFKPANVFGRKLEPVSYMANPLPEHKRAVKGAKEEKAWHPASRDKTDATRSIVRMNL